MYQSVRGPDAEQQRAACMSPSTPPERNDWRQFAVGSAKLGSPMLGHHHCTISHAVTHGAHLWHPRSGRPG